MKALALATALLTAGCASMVNGKFQNVPVTSTPPHAAIELACPGQEPSHVGYTPTTLRLRRADDGCRITISKLGYVEQTIRFEQARSAATALNLVPGAVIGGIGALLIEIPAMFHPAVSDVADAAFNAGASVPDRIDEHTGAAFKLVPTEVNVRLARRP